MITARMNSCVYDLLYLSYMYYMAIKNIFIVIVIKIYLSVQNIVVRKSRTFEDCDIQKIYWCFINITINFDGIVSWVLNRLMNSINSSLEWFQM